MEYIWYKNNRMVTKSDDMGRVWVFEMTQEYFDDYIGNQKQHKGDLIIHSKSVKSLGIIEHVDGELMIDDDHTSLSNLEYVKSGLDVSFSNITSLGNLKHVGRDLNLYDTEITSLGKLEHVGGKIICRRNSDTYEFLMNSKFKDQVKTM